VIGLDGLEPSIVESMLSAGDLPHMATLVAHGGLARVATTYPAQTPVAWSTFATGTNPGGHGIFDFLRRDPQTYLPDNGLTRYEHTNPLLPPKAVNLRRGTPVWDRLASAKIPSVVIRCPCTYPPDRVRGRMLSGMGVPDLRGGFGTPTFYSTQECSPRESEQVVRLPEGPRPRIATYVIGPRHPRTKANSQCDITLELDPSQKRLFVRSAGRPRELEAREGQWSGWLRLKFKLGPLQSVRGIVRFLLVRLEPALELYASPVNFDPDAPLFPISSPDGYAGDLAAELGNFYTTGLVEDHNGLVNERFGEEAFLEQCEDAWREREAMMTHELGRFRAGLFYCLFDTPDRVQHMLWRFREPEHPANRGRAAPAEFRRAVEEHYRRGDQVVGRALEAVDGRTLLIVLSDHGFGSFQRGFHLNTWLYERGLLAVRAGLAPGAAAGDLLRSVDWERTRAYAIGLTGLYLNLQGREARGTVRPDEAENLAAAIAQELTGLEDPERGTVAVRSAFRREQVYAGPFAHESPDVIVNYAAGYRVSWSTSLGGVAATPVFEDNTRKWAGDHIIDPALVPGVLLMNRVFRRDDARLVDLAPTILAALGQSAAPGMEGRSLIGQGGTGLPNGPAEIDEAERVVRERLSGLGYV
jgi:predicted AlkP superfamily phosphohydrolase/phosphomutase